MHFLSSFLVIFYSYWVYLYGNQFDTVTQIVYLQSVLFCKSLELALKFFDRILTPKTWMITKKNSYYIVSTSSNLFHKFSVLWIYEFVKKLILFIHSNIHTVNVNKNINFRWKIHRFVLTEFVKLSDEFDIGWESTHFRRKIKGLIIRNVNFLTVELWRNFCWSFKTLTYFRAKKKEKENLTITFFWFWQISITY